MLSVSIHLIVVKTSFYKDVGKIFISVRSANAGDFALAEHTDMNIFPTKGKKSLYVCMYVPRIVRKLFLRLSSNLAGVLLMTRRCSCVFLVQFGHMRRGQTFPQNGHGRSVNDVKGFVSL